MCFAANNCFCPVQGWAIVCRLAVRLSGAPCYMARLLEDAAHSAREAARPRAIRQVEAGRACGATRAAQRVRAEPAQVHALAQGLHTATGCLILCVLNGERRRES